MIVGFITMKRSSWNHTVSAPKPRTRMPDIHSIGEILPSFHFDTIIATTIAAMKATVPLIAPGVAAKEPSPPEVTLSVRQKTSKGTKPIAKLSQPCRDGGGEGRSEEGRVGKKVGD